MANTKDDPEAFRAEVARVTAEVYGIPEGVARRGYDLAEAAFNRAWSEATDFIRLEHDKNVMTVAMFMLGGIMEATAHEKRKLAEFGMLLVRMKTTNPGEQN